MTRVLAFVGTVGMYFSFCHTDPHHYPVQTIPTALFKTLPIVLLALMTMTTETKNTLHLLYKRRISLGIVFSMIGDICLVWHDDLFLGGVIFFGLAHIFYTRAFRFHPWGVHAGSVLVIPGILSFLFFAAAIEGLGTKAMCLGYLLMIYTMWWRSIVRWQAYPSVGSLCSVFGAFIFLISDFLIGLDRWIGDVPYGPGLVMVTYYSAQLLIALSVPFY